ncbi:flagellar basal body P-ring protein FlgI [Natroniella sulfidigena]|uniref:flagellar basal body P-ring protein FlgI n=1 Tax=Natroniella sulfidigena TaxID=723921 RepID=UPI00200A21A3|nr:flagellar basal body P-ring protein FlgI [Natroniella sulfidigena]MCK8816380.1 flagellar basal body P-ring protein FlgI [Natroniella sulfidigena]
MRKSYKLLSVIIFLLILISFNSDFTLALAPNQEGVDDPLVRIKDITRIGGVRNNQLIGYGIVVGLDGSGDGQSSQLTVQSIANMLQNFGVDIAQDELGANNAAAVMVTAELPPFVHPGSEIDVTLSSIGDADSLEGGTLLMTPLTGPSGDGVYAVAQGAVSVGGFTAGQGGAQVSQNHTTVGRVPNGAIVEEEVPMDFNTDNELTLVLSNPNFATAQRIADVINQEFGYTQDGGYYAHAKDAGQVEVQIPSYFRDRVVNFISRVEELEVRPDTEAKVVINERTGTVVMGHNVRLSRVSVSHGDLTVTIATTEEAVDVGEDEVEIIEEEEVDVEEEEASLVVLPKGADISDVVTGLNAVGATPRDVISIIQAIKEAGALHADLEIM